MRNKFLAVLILLFCSVAGFAQFEKPPFSPPVNWSLGQIASWSYETFEHYIGRSETGLPALPDPTRPPGSLFITTLSGEPPRFYINISNSWVRIDQSVGANHSVLSNLDYASSGHTGFAPTVHYHSGVYADFIHKHHITSVYGMPPVTFSNAGKFLKTESVDGSSNATFTWEAISIPEVPNNASFSFELLSDTPDYSGNAEKVLAVNATENGLEWVENSGAAIDPSIYQTKDEIGSITATYYNTITTGHNWYDPGCKYRIIHASPADLTTPSDWTLYVEPYPGYENPLWAMLRIYQDDQNWVDVNLTKTEPTGATPLKFSASTTFSLNAFYEAPSGGGYTDLGIVQDDTFGAFPSYQATITNGVANDYYLGYWNDGMDVWFYVWDSFTAPGMPGLVLGSDLPQPGGPLFGGFVSGVNLMDGATVDFANGGAFPDGMLMPANSYFVVHYQNAGPPSGGFIPAGYKYILPGPGSSDLLSKSFTGGDLEWSKYYNDTFFIIPDGIARGSLGSSSGKNLANFIGLPATPGDVPEQYGKKLGYRSQLFDIIDGLFNRINEAPERVKVSFIGPLSSANQVIYSQVAGNYAKVRAGAPGFFGSVETYPLSTQKFSFRVKGQEKGYIDVPISGSGPIYMVVNSDFEIFPGDKISVIGPAAYDTNMTGISFFIKGDW